MTDHPSSSHAARAQRLPDTLMLILSAWLSAFAFWTLLFPNEATPFTLAHVNLYALWGLLLCTLIGSVLLFWLRRRLDDLAPFALFAAVLLFILACKNPLAGTLGLWGLLGVELLALWLFDPLARLRRAPFLTAGLLALALGDLVLLLKDLPLEPLYQEFSKSPLSGSKIGIALLGSLLLAILLALFWHGLEQTKAQRALPWILWAAFLLQALLIARVGVARTLSLSTPTFDFNLFVQMFHHMADTGLPTTTLERNQPLSHFLVHLSPIYYLMLPFFMIFRHAVTLQILQALVVASGIFPMHRLAKGLGISPRRRLFLLVAYATSTALITSNFYDLHENCFLAPLILWVLVFSLEKKPWPLAAAVLLTLFIKEDAALYLWAISGYLWLDRRQHRMALALFLTSLSYFLLSLFFLKQFGDGAMTGRFGSLISDPTLGLASVPLTVIAHPGFFFSRLFMPQKLRYLCQMLLPLGLLPLLNRSLGRWFLILPLIVMNLVQDWPYQYNISWQYNYGSYVLLFFLALLALKDHPEAQELPQKRPKGRPLGAFQAKLWPLRREGLALLLIPAIVFGALFSTTHLIKNEHYRVYLKQEKPALDAMKQSMDELPKNASVLATTFLTGYLADRPILYDPLYNVQGDRFYPADYVVLDLRPGYEEESEQMLRFFIAQGYDVQTHRPGWIVVLKKGPASRKR
ncbi:hypothetical protein ABB02_00345 [Clostridiaceae bacterium JG1575]|nr:hypothetical protein ABB02_00345 [Clostridiaceae bacterium JG1575]